MAIHDDIAYMPATEMAAAIRSEVAVACRDDSRACWSASKR